MRYEAVVDTGRGTLVCCYWPVPLEEIQKRAEADDPIWRRNKVKFRPLTAERSKKYEAEWFDRPGEGFRPDRA